MKKTFRLILCAAAVCAIPSTFCSCSDDDDENSGIITDIPATEVEDDTTPDAIAIDKASWDFVGRWSGSGPSLNSTKYTDAPGTWQFNNDGTYEWRLSAKEDDVVLSGEWSYSDGKITIESNSGFNWTEVVYDTETGKWSGTVTKDDVQTTYTYTRKTDKVVTPGNIKIYNYKSDGFSIRDTLKNYLLCGEEVKCGVCYAKSDADPTDMSTWTRVYADGIYQKNGTRGFHDVEITGLDNDGKYYLCGFLEHADGTFTYGNPYKAICVTPPANTVCMGDTTFWCTTALETLYSDDEVEDALATIGGALPTVAETEYLAANATFSVEGGQLVVKSTLTGNSLIFNSNLRAAPDLKTAGTYMTADFRREGANGFYFYKSTTGEGIGKVPEYQSKAAILPVIKKAVTWE